jgi:hypothetical protein
MIQEPGTTKKQKSEKIENRKVLNGTYSQQGGILKKQKTGKY